jgi:hypothetical protein
VNIYVVKKGRPAFNEFSQRVLLFTFDGEEARYDSQRAGSDSIEMTREWMPPGSKIVPADDKVQAKGVVEYWVSQ